MKSLIETFKQKIKTRKAKISIIGFGYIGTCIGAVLADRGFSVLGVDNNEAIVSEISQGYSSINEPKLETLIQKNAKSLPITDERMTRVWITLDHGIEFVLNSINLMAGGELFIPKSPSIKIIDLVKALDKNIKYHIIGIRPGEKLHEVLCPEDSARDTIEFKNYYLIRPSIDFTKGKTNYYKINTKNEKGKIVKSNFVYSSDTNSHFLNIKELKKLS